MTLITESKVRFVLAAGDRVFSPRVTQSAKGLARWEAVLRCSLPVHYHLLSFYLLVNHTSLFTTVATRTQLHQLSPSHRFPLSHPPRETRRAGN